MKEIHLKAPRGWINDPNGFIYYNGEYHLFYQHFPYAPRWGRMHWGHAVSSDLMNWKHLDIALFPTKTDDMDGCFSGSAIEKDGAMHLLYTGVRYDVRDPENTNCCLDDKFTAAQLHISSEDGYCFDNFGGKTTVIPPIADTKTGDQKNTRDPKVWRGSDGNYYMVLGSTVNNRGRLLFYKSADLIHWDYVNYATAEGYGWMWECPDYFRADGADVLIFSPMGTKHGNQAVCTLVEFDEQSCSMKIGSEFRFLDYGLDLYAPQSTTDKDGRRIVVAWLRMPEPIDNNTIGMFSMPRVCEVKDGHIFFRPHPDIRAKFTRKTTSPSEIYMVRASLAEGEQLDIGGYIIRREQGRIIADRTAVIRNHDELRNTFETPVLNGAEIEAYVDGNMVEVFVNGGEYVITNAVYGLSRRVVGNAELYAMDDTKG
ncbi:MAG: glycoside hydrolase family 32 protein [Oscillospiraceae bacterium]